MSFLKRDGRIGRLLGTYPRELSISLILAAMVALLYGRTVFFDFVALDDVTYVKENYVVRGGLSLANVVWAFTAMYAANWHPLTWLSHMLDYQLWGMWPGMHHLTSVLLHSLNALLLFSLLRYATGTVWRSAAVAALFAVHPLHVESVAWIAERKDVLSTFFWMLTLLGYVRYAKHRSVGRYLLVMLFFALGLMAKPMLVTLPFVLLLLDLWPLGRLFDRPADGMGQSGRRGGGMKPLEDPEAAGEQRAAEALMKAEAPQADRIRVARVLALAGEKIPLFIMATASSVITFIAQRAGGAVSTLQEASLSVRISNALTSYVAYLWKTVWPLDLAVFYPLRRAIHPPLIVAAAIFILVVTAAALITLRKRPYVAFGWFWYLGTLVPVIGIVQVGAQSMADRYTYIPLVGIFVALVWGLSDLFGKKGAGQVFLASAATAAIVACMVLTWAQVGTWRNSITLFTRALETTPENFLTYNNLGCAYFDKGDLQAAIRQFNGALKVYPAYAVARANLGLVYDKLGDRKKSLENYRAAVKIGSRSAGSHFTIAKGLFNLGEVDEAIAEYRKTLELNPYHAAAWNNLGVALDAKDETEEEMACYRKALEIDQGYSSARLNLAKSLSNEERYDEAIEQVRIGLRNDPENSELREYADKLAREKGTPSS
jgi:tetratricopeptide (TPR) repeat protein